MGVSMTYLDESKWDEVRSSGVDQGILPLFDKKKKQKPLLLVVILLFLMYDCSISWLFPSQIT